MFSTCVNLIQNEAKKTECLLGALIKFYDSENFRKKKFAFYSMKICACAID